MSVPQTEPQAVVAVASDLTAIVQLSEALEANAVANAGNKTMPGGNAMVALAGVASPSAWARQLDALEAAALETARELGVSVESLWPGSDEQPGDWEPPLQSLLFWSEAWRLEHGYPLRPRPTLLSESTFIRWALPWAWANEPHWSDFAQDVHAARRRLEDELHAGRRPTFRGVPCLYDECRGTRLIRTTVPTRGPQGEKAWRLTDWHCPQCKRSWTEHEYERNIYAAIVRSKVDIVGDDMWCTVDHASTRIGRPEGTIRSWVSRGDVSAACWLDGRHTYVLFSDVEHRHQLALARRAKWLAAAAAKQTTSV